MKSLMPSRRDRRQKYLGLLLTGMSALVPSAPARADFVRALTTGVAYPTLDDATVKNSAVLNDEREGKAARLDYDPNGGYSGMFAGSSENYGLGLALNTLGAGTLTLGGGGGNDTFHVGANMSLSGTIDPSKATFGVSGTVGGVSGFRLAATLSSLLKSESDNLTVGVGYAKSRDYQLELDIAVPAASLTASGSVYTLSAAVVKYFGGFGAGGFATAPAGISPLALASPTFGAMAEIHPFGQVSIDARYTTGLTGGFGFGVMGKF